MIVDIIFNTAGFIDSWIQNLNGLAQEQGPGLTLVLTIILLVVGIAFIVFSGKSNVRSQIGIGLLVGALFGFTSYLNQVILQRSDFESSVNLTQDLSGFDPQDQSMRGMSLADKNFHGANLKNADLQQANLKYSDFREAVLRDAQLNKAVLFYAKFLRADLTGADLEGADLRGAKITTPDFKNAKLSGARVNQNTCWNIPLESPESALPTAKGKKLASDIANAGLDSDDGTLGRVCYKKEVGSSAQPEAPAQGNPIMICPEQPYLFPRTDCPEIHGE